MMPHQFRSLLVEKTEDLFSVDVKELSIDDLHQGDVVIRVAYSSLNYKDALASLPNGKIARVYPLIPGIDFAGTVVSSSNSQFKEGDEVISASPEIGVSYHGGFSEYARVPGNWLVSLPKGLSMKQAMILGTAGFTAALSIQRLEENGLTPEKGPIMVKGATGGVGSLAVAMLAKRKYDVVASTGKETAFDFLRKLGATEILTREDLSPETVRPLEKQRWAGAIDAVGGKNLSYLASSIKYGGSIALSGMTGGTEFTSSIFPFILRGINLLGINKDGPMEQNIFIWNRLATDLHLGQTLDEIHHEITLDDLPAMFPKILSGQILGRIIVKLEI